MEPENWNRNKFFTLNSEGENRYYIQDFDAEKTKGLNNVYLLSKEVKENSVVLDIGCAQGRFGKTLKEMGCSIYGIDIDEKAVEYAKKSGYYDEILIMDINNKSVDDNKKLKKMLNYFDVIIISDVLEHMSDPTNVILEFSKFLKEDGIILISVPNIAHISVLLNLMNDKFNYQDVGILDNTHLKFFTKTSFIDWIEQINETFDNIKFECEYLGATFYNNDILNNVKENYIELFNILESSVNYNGLQILFKLTKLAEGKIPVKLLELKKESKVNVVKLLGESLKGKIKEIENHKPVEGERLWYESTLKWYTNRLQELEKAIEWHQENDKNIRESLNWHIEKVKELEKAVEWHQENDKNIRESLNWHIERVENLEKAIEWHNENDRNLKTLMEEKEREFEKQRDRYRQELLELRKKIFEIESSRSWRWTKFLRRGKK
ncbi:methyltransferase domain-containing protein [Clostridium saccharoperbutylacetonicum]|uniref:methyltransferase domain-containing protein n=1 Tax=Clostridium saccharoperbutylacetonicum TaxID=36745 RepID=UPI000983A4CE|nr:methyltransferase domain-containing protein [Clostridium saccharoperbutylacetonicum]AQR97836.1 ubiquinone biosynthesis O-methyltransferase [Clostridium saccharoperbutylacetonicum]NSB33728.1 2-polyprenyl-3-methyl-5-hydroxy-6-metoxy-1,4-benzoquinol methylase [Clostridium saccharoperbutylacetonicum]